MTLYWLTPLMPLQHQARSRTGSGLLAYFGNHFYSPFLQTTNRHFARKRGSKVAPGRGQGYGDQTKLTISTALLFFFFFLRIPHHLQAVKAERHTASLPHIEKHGSREDAAVNKTWVLIKGAVVLFGQLGTALLQLASFSAAAGELSGNE